VIIVTLMVRGSVLAIDSSLGCGVSNTPHPRFLSAAVNRLFSEGMLKLFCQYFYRSFAPMATIFLYVSSPQYFMPSLSRTF
jgi:hypothetical protein